MTEDHLLGAVIDLARALGIAAVHFRAARTEAGWRTAVQGDGKGWPDLTLVGAGGVLFRELKSTRGGLAAEQVAWLERLRAAGMSAEVWRPADLHSGRIAAELQAVRRPRVGTPS